MVNDPLRIIHVTSASQMIYGAVQSMLTLAEAQKKHGDHVSFVTFKGKPFGSELRKLNWETREIKVRAKIDPFAIAKMRRHFLLQKADIIQTHLSTSSINGCLAARLARIPCVGTVHGMSGKLSFVFADHLIGVSKGVKQHLESQGVKSSKVTAVYNGVDLPTTLLTKSEARKQFGLSSDSFVIGTVARLTDMKGIDSAIRTIAEVKKSVPNIQYALVGDGEGKDRYLKLAHDLGVTSEIHFLGYQKNVFDSLVAMDLFLFPSLKEALGMAVVEALRVGLPVVSTNVGGLPEVVDDRVGKLVPPNDVSEMTSAICDLINSSSLDQLKENAIARAEELFSVESMRSGTQSVYESLLHKRNNSK